MCVNLHHIPWCWLEFNMWCSQLWWQPWTTTCSCYSMQKFLSSGFIETISSWVTRTLFLERLISIEFTLCWSEIEFGFEDSPTDTPFFILIHFQIYIITFLLFSLSFRISSFLLNTPTTALLHLKVAHILRTTVPWPHHVRNTKRVCVYSLSNHQM